MLWVENKDISLMLQVSHLLSKSFSAIDALKNEPLFNVSEQYWEKAEFPFEVIPKLGALHIAGGTIKVF